MRSAACVRMGSFGEERCRSGVRDEIARELGWLGSNNTVPIVTNRSANRQGRELEMKAIKERGPRTVKTFGT